MRIVLLCSVILSCGLLHLSCTPQQYARRADKAAYGTLTSAQRAALGESSPFDIAYDPLSEDAAPDAAIDAPPPQPDGVAASQPASRYGSICVGDKRIPLGGETAVMISVREATEIAFRNSRTFQEQKESLYIQALAVANGRRFWSWGGGFGGQVNGDIRRTAGPDGTTDSASGNVGVEILQKLKSGGQLVLGGGLDIASDLTGWGSGIVGSMLRANFSQPLLRGGWNGLAYEPQYRMERDLIFSAYTYQRFGQTFATDVIRQYYAVLEQRDRLENERVNIERLKETLALTEILVKGEQVSPIEEDLARQNVLDAEVRLRNNESAYLDALDQFKLSLGLPLAARIDVEYPAALEALQEQGPLAVPLDVTRATSLALRTRPDVLRQRACARDADRDVEIAANGFLPQLDLLAGISATGTPPRQPANIRWGDNTRYVGLALHYELDQTDNRDAYRRAQIAADRSRRDLTAFTDSVALEVRQRYRSLDQSRQNYDIQQRSVQIAQRRSKLATLQLKEGLASTRDVLEAEESLRNAQNGKTSALISYTTTRLEFLATLGLIDVDEKGVVHEREQSISFDRIEARYPYVSDEGR